MSDSSADDRVPHSALHRLAAVIGVGLGGLLLLGSYGHFEAVWPALTGDPAATSASRASLLLPGLVLISAGLINIAVVRMLWVGTRWGLLLALLSNLLAVVYLGLLLGRGVPDHPIGLFLAVVASHALLLGAIRAGLQWPAGEQTHARG